MSDSSPSGNTRSRAAGAAPITIDDLAHMMNTRLDALDTRLADNTTRLDTLDSRLADNTASIADINASIATVNTRLTSLESEVAIKSRPSSRHSSRPSSPLPSPPAPSLPTLHSQDVRRQLPSQQLSAATQELSTTPTTTAVPVSEAYDDNTPVVVTPMADVPVATTTAAKTPAKVEPKADGPVTTQEAMQDNPVLFNEMASPHEKFGTCLYRTEWDEARTRELSRNNFKVPVKYWARHTVPYLKDAVWRGFGPPTSSVSHFGRMVA